MIIYNRFKNDLEFEWDEGNIDKNWIKHKVEYKEAEEIFFDINKLVGVDNKHSTIEARCLIFGVTEKKRYLTACFTVRKGKVRVISVRSMNKKERNKYDKEKI
jgi:uncharacterized DUF497 family protein